MTEITIPDNLTKTMEFRVNKEHTAVHLKSGSVAVLSTPSMILFMEQSAGSALEEILPEGYSSVGIEVCIKHRKAVNVGKDVQALSKVVSVDDKKVEFEVQVMHGDQLVGDGRHTRYIIDVDRFMQSL